MAGATRNGKTFTLAVTRYDPEVDDGPRVQDCEVRLLPGMTLLDALLTVRADTDPSLTFRHSCRGGACGACGVQASGRPVLACRSRVESLLQTSDRVEVGPMANHPVIRDLVVDMDPFFSRIVETGPWLQPEAEPATDDAPFEMYEEEVDRLRLSQICIACGLCDSAVRQGEVSPDFAGPAALTRVYRFAADVRDGSDRKRLQYVGGPGGIWDCAPSQSWSDACPLGIDPVDKIERLRKSAVANRLGKPREFRPAVASG